MMRRYHATLGKSISRWFMRNLHRICGYFGLQTLQRREDRVTVLEQYVDGFSRVYNHDPLRRRPNYGHIRYFRSRNRGSFGR